MCSVCVLCVWPPYNKTVSRTTLSTMISVSGNFVLLTRTMLLNSCGFSPGGKWHVGALPAVGGIQACTSRVQLRFHMFHLQDYKINLNYGSHLILEVRQFSKAKCNSQIHYTNKGPPQVEAGCGSIHSYLVARWNGKHHIPASSPPLDK